MAEQGYLAGIVGCGRIGALYDEEGDGSGVYTHAGMYRATEGLRLACATDPAADRLRAFGDYWECSGLYDDVASMLAECPVDVLSVTSPDATHEHVVRAAIGVARPPRIILLEKPMAEDAATAQALLQAAEAAGVTLLVNYARRWDRMHRQIRDCLQSGALGDIRWISGYYVRGLRHNGCHLVNMMRFLGGEIEQAEIVGSRDRGSLAGDPSPHVRVVFRNGAEGMMVGLDQDGYAYSVFDLDIFGTLGRMRVTADGARAEMFSARQDPRFSNFRTLNPDPDVFGSTYETAMLEAGKGLVRLLKDPASSPVNHAREAVADMQVIESVLSV